MVYAADVDRSEIVTLGEVARRRRGPVLGVSPSLGVEVLAHKSSTTTCCCRCNLGPSSSLRWRRVVCRSACVIAPRRTRTEVHLRRSVLCLGFDCKQAIAGYGLCSDNPDVPEPAPEHFRRPDDPDSALWRVADRGSSRRVVGRASNVGLRTVPRRSDTHRDARTLSPVSTGGHRTVAP
jgi:hypothetical protein